MIALALTEVKECMAKLLLSEIFDPFYFIEGEIVTFGTFSLNGYLNKDFFDKEVRFNIMIADVNKIIGEAIKVFEGKINL